MGALLSTLNAGLLGFKPYTLFGKRLLPVIWTISASVTASCNVVARLSGSEIKLIASRPIPPLAISLPRCGVQMKTARFMRGLRLKISACITRLLLELRARISLAVGQTAFSHIGG